MSEMLTRWLEDTTHARRPLPNQHPDHHSGSASDPTTPDSDALMPVSGTEATAGESVESDLPSTSGASHRTKTAACPDVSDDSSAEKYVSAPSEMDEDGSSSADSSDESVKRGATKSKKTAWKLSSEKKKKSSSSNESSDPELVTSQRGEDATDAGQGEGEVLDTGVECGVDVEEGGKTKVQYDGPKSGRQSVHSDDKDVPSGASSKTVASSKTIVDSSSSDRDEERGKRLPDGKKRKRSIGNSPSGSLNDHPNSAIDKKKTDVISGGKTPKHLVKSQRVKEAGKEEPDDLDSSSSSSSSDSDDDSKGMECSSAIDDDMLKLGLKGKPKLELRKLTPDNVESQASGGEGASGGKSAVCSLSSTDVQSSGSKTKNQETTASVHVKKAASYSRHDAACSSGYSGVGGGHDGVRVRLEDSSGSSIEDEALVFALSERQEDTHPQVGIKTSFTQNCFNFQFLLF